MYNNVVLLRGGCEFKSEKKILNIDSSDGKMGNGGVLTLGSQVLFAYPDTCGKLSVSSSMRCVVKYGSCHVMVQMDKVSPYSRWLWVQSPLEGVNYFYFPTIIDKSWRFSFTVKHAKSPKFGSK